MKSELTVRSAAVGILLAGVTIFALAEDSPPPVPENLGSLDEVAGKVEGLRETSVAWRKIDWKHCLLEGMAASREEGKPILLWCHIDLPADDKRC